MFECMDLCMGSQYYDLRCVPGYEWATAIVLV
jgi:hypothetical protein